MFNSKLVAGLIALVASGCGTDSIKDALGIEGESDAGAVEVQIDTEGDTIGDLTDDEKGAICQSLAQGINDGVSFRTRCNVAAVISSFRAAADGEAAVRAACNKTLEPCDLLISTGTTGSLPDIPVPECPIFQGDTAGCVTAIADLQACLNELGQQTADSFKALSCDDLTTDVALDPPDISDTIESRPDQGPCVTVTTECPGVFGTAEAPVPG